MLFVGNGAVDRENLLCKGIAIMHVTKGTSTCASASCCSGEGALTSNFLRRRNGTICIIYFAAYKTAAGYCSMFFLKDTIAILADSVGTILVFHGGNDYSRGTSGKGIATFLVNDFTPNSRGRSEEQGSPEITSWRGIKLLIITFSCSPPFTWWP